MQIALGGLLVMSMLTRPPHVQAAGNSSHTSTVIESRERQRTSQPASPTTMTPQSLSDHAGVLQERVAPDCEGEAPSAISVTAMLNRIVRASGTVRGVQCPIPIVPEPIPTEETHP